MNSIASIGFSPLLPWPWLAGLAALSLLVWGLAAWRRARGMWWRLVLPVILLGALANPRLVAEDHQSLPDVVLVVVDDSPSQDIGGRHAQTEDALAQLRARLARQPDLDVRVERVAGGQGEDGTRLFTAMDRALADLPRRRLAGVVIITDGRVHDVPTDLGQSLDAPVHALITGRPGERDRRLVVTRSPGYALVGKTAEIRLRVDDPGQHGDAAVEIQVDGQSYLNTVLPVNREVSVDVPIGHAGPTVVELTAEAGPDELSLGNNNAAVEISGVRDRLKVLLISGEPHAGERTWRNLLKADPAVDLVHFTILRPPEKDDRTPIRELALISFPVRELFEERLKDFDLVVFDRYRRRGVLSAGYYQNLVDYVRGGGALLVAMGPEYAGTNGISGELFDTPLADVLPGQPNGQIRSIAFRPQVTEAGKRHPVTANLPDMGDTAGPRWGSWLRRIDVWQKRGTAVLATPDGAPLLLLDRVGDGRVAQLLSDTIWLWARGYEGGGPHDELLRRLAHWLMKEPELEEESLAAEIKGDRLEVVRHSLGDAAVAVTVTAPNGDKQQVSLVDQGDGRGTAQLQVAQPGLWTVTDGVHTAIAAVGSLASLEMAELSATTDILAPVANTTGGSARFLAQGGMPDIRRVAPGHGAAGRDWIGLAVRGDHTVTGVHEVPLLPVWLLLPLLLGGLLAGWWREGR